MSRPRAIWRQRPAAQTKRTDAHAPVPSPCLVWSTSSVSAGWYRRVALNFFPPHIATRPLSWQAEACGQCVCGPAIREKAESPAWPLFLAQPTRIPMPISRPHSSPHRDDTIACHSNHANLRSPSHPVTQPRLRGQRLRLLAAQSRDGGCDCGCGCWPVPPRNRRSQHHRPGRCRHRLPRGAFCCGWCGACHRRRRQNCGLSHAAATANVPQRRHLDERRRLPRPGCVEGSLSPGPPCREPAAPRPSARVREPGSPPHAPARHCWKHFDGRRREARTDGGGRRPHLVRRRQPSLVGATSAGGGVPRWLPSRGHHHLPPAPQCACGQR